VPYYIAIFAVSNFFGPLLLGRYFDTVGRIPMISGTYLGSAAIVAALGVLLVTTHLTAWTFMAFVLGAFFLASAGASAAYLTVSEVFPMETRALAIAFFFGVGTATGGIVGPVLFGQIIHSGNRHLVALGFFIGAGAMALGGIAELLFGIRAEQQSLENIAKPLTAEEAEELLPLPVTPEARPLPDAYRERHEAVRSRELAEDERPAAAERRAMSPAHGGPRGRGGRAPRREPRRARHRERGAGLRVSGPLRGGAPNRGGTAAAAEQRALMFRERAAALIAAAEAEAQTHAMLAESAAERARARAAGVAAEARLDAARLRGPAADLARARAEMHESWAAVHAASAAALEARALGDDASAAENERQAKDRELIARAAEQRVDAAEHRARAAALREEDAILSRAEREQRIRERSVRDLERERHGLRRFRPGPGGSFYSPGMMGTSGTGSRLAARAREDLDREISVIAEALRQHGALEREELRNLVGGRYWGPGRFAAAVRAAIEEGLARRRSRTVLEPGPTARAVEPGAEAPREAGPNEQGTGRSRSAAAP
jgi:Major Facilitator Superfamily